MAGAKLILSVICRCSCPGDTRQEVILVDACFFNRADEETKQGIDRRCHVGARLIPETFLINTTVSEVIQDSCITPDGIGSILDRPNVRQLVRVGRNVSRILDAVSDNAHQSVNSCLNF